jgi:hypothetical protein
MEQQNFAAEFVRTQAFTGGRRSNEQGCFFSYGEIVDFVNIPSRCLRKVHGLISPSFGGSD